LATCFRSCGDCENRARPSVYLHRLEEVLIFRTAHGARDGELLVPARSTRSHVMNHSPDGRRPLSALFEKDQLRNLASRAWKSRTSQQTTCLRYLIQVRAGEIVCLAACRRAADRGRPRGLGIEPRIREIVWTESAPRLIAPDAVQMGMAYVPEDRQRHGCCFPCALIIT